MTSFIDMKLRAGFMLARRVLYITRGLHNVLERDRRVDLRMTPAETCVLFSAHVLAFIFIWFTGFAEGTNQTGSERTCKAANSKGSFPEIGERLEKKDHSQYEVAWNVASFFGLQQK